VSSAVVGVGAFAVDAVLAYAAAVADEAAAKQEGIGFGFGLGLGFGFGFGLGLGLGLGLGSNPNLHLGRRRVAGGGRRSRGCAAPPTDCARPSGR